MGFTGAAGDAAPAADDVAASSRIHLLDEKGRSTALEEDARGRRADRSESSAVRRIVRCRKSACVQKP